MFTTNSNYFFWLIIFCISISHSQTLEGYVLDEKTKEPLYGVSVYFDGTTNGTATNTEGKFRITYKASTESALVISYLGYKKQVLDVRKLPNGVQLYLVANPEALGTVYLENDTWSRKRKMAIFRREFIGNRIKASDCKILNEEDIKVVFNPTTNKLTAYASKPILIFNKYLGYTISYTMEEFEASLEVSLMGSATTISVYVEGTSFYKEQHKKLRNKHKEVREKEYGQSVLYFMRSLAKMQLTENKFQIFHRGFIVPPYMYFKVVESGEDRKITMKKEKLIILYDGDYKSFLTIRDKNKEFTINKFGNYSPPKKIFFGGVLGGKRIAKTLPLDYSF